MTRSKAHLPGNEEGERAERDDIEAKLGNTDEEINRFILGPDDVEASPTQVQPQEQPQAPVHAFDHLVLLLDRFDHFQQSEEAMQQTLDDHCAYTTTQMTYLQEQITALSTQIQDLACLD